jgi:hypothetical protein
MAFSTRLKTLLTLLKTGQLVVSGDGCTVRQLPSGEYQISLSAGDLAGNDKRGSGYSDNGGGNDTGPTKPRFPATNELPKFLSGSYGGHKTGRTIDGVGGDDLY